MSYQYRRTSFGPGLSPAVLNLILANAVMFGIGVFFPRLVEDWLALVPLAVVPGGQVWRVVSYMFVHFDFGHVFFNMLGLYFFGPQLERVWGSQRFYIYYFVTGVGAGIAAVPFYWLFGDPRIPIIGASGAIFGVLVGFALLYPNQPIYLYFLMPVKAKWLILFYGAMEFFATVSYTGGARSGVANVAHLAGLVIGYFYLRGLSDLKSLPFRFRQWRRRRQFKALSRRDHDDGPTYH